MGGLAEGIAFSPGGRYLYAGNFRLAPSTESVPAMDRAPDLGVKPAAANFDLISSLDGKLASSMARTAGKKFGTTTSFSRVPVRMQT